MNIVVMTKDEPCAFDLVRELEAQMNGRHRLLVWDDFSSPEWLRSMSVLAEVRQNALQSHFANHRNRVKCQFRDGEWILMLDADEWIQPGFIAAMELETSGVDGRDVMFFERRNTFHEDTGSSDHPSVDYRRPFKPDFQGRAFLNLPHIRYEGHVHEGLKGFDWPVYLKGPPFTIIHHKRNVQPRYAALWNPPK